MDRNLLKVRARYHILKQAALIAALLMPVCLLYARAGAEFAMGIADFCFLMVSFRQRNWRWVRSPWFVISLLWWAAEMVCSIPAFSFGGVNGGWTSLIQAIVLIRMPLFAMALGTWILDNADSRHRFWLVLVGSEAWIAIESWQQQIFGVNIFGDHRWPDGSLTGPFWAPRAGPPFSHLLFPVALPIIAALLVRRTVAMRLAALGLGLFGFATVLVIGQRMPFLLAGLGLAVTALMFRPIRVPAVILGCFVLLAVPALRFASPRSFDKLVLETTRQVGDFAESPYGKLYTRAVVMIEHSPWHGYGFNGFRDFCKEPRFGRGLPSLGVGPTSLAHGACNIHPHNFYLQAAVVAGIPGLCLFIALNLAWLLLLWRSLRRISAGSPSYPLRLGFFIGVLTFAWPIASTGDFAVLPMAGWSYVLIGLGLALAHSEPIGAHLPTPARSSWG